MVAHVSDEILVLHRRRLFTMAMEAWEQGEWQRAAALFVSISQLLEKEAGSLGPGQARELRLQAAQSFAETAREAMQNCAAPDGDSRSAEHRGDDDHSEWACTPSPRVTLEDVVGLKDVKAEILRTVIYPFLNPDIAARYGLGVPRGILMYGPPGTGKTLLAQAIAGMIDASLFVVTGAELLSKWHGQSAQNVASLFAAARNQKRSMILIDELQGIAVDPDQAPASEASQSVLAQLLQEIQGFKQSTDNSVMLVGATNYPWLLPAPLIRLGRFDVHIHVSLPDAADREALFRRKLENLPCSPDLDFESLAHRTQGYSAADITAICLSALRRALDQHMREGRPALVTQAMFDSVIRTTRPSARPEQIAACEAWANQNC